MFHGYMMKLYSIQILGPLKIKQLNQLFSVETKLENYERMAF